MEHDMLKEYVNNQEWELAREELGCIPDEEFDDNVAILASAICFYEGKLEEAYDYIRRGLLIIMQTTNYMYALEIIMRRRI